MNLTCSPGQLITSTEVTAGPERAFAVISDPRELNGLTPAWFTLRMEPESSAEAVRIGTRFRYRLRLGPTSFTWVSEVDKWEAPVSFSYRQAKGPYRAFWHDHQIEAIPGGCLITDVVEYRLWTGPLGHRSIVLPMLRRVFEHRSRALVERLGG